MSSSLYTCEECGTIYSYGELLGWGAKFHRRKRTTCFRHSNGKNWCAGSFLIGTPGQDRSGDCKSRSPCCGVELNYRTNGRCYCPSCKTFLLRPDLINGDCTIDTDWFWYPPEERWRKTLEVDRDLKAAAEATNKTRSEHTMPDTYTAPLDSRMEIYDGFLIVNAESVDELFTLAADALHDDNIDTVDLKNFLQRLHNVALHIGGYKTTDVTERRQLMSGSSWPDTTKTPAVVVGCKSQPVPLADN